MKASNGKTITASCVALLAMGGLALGAAPLRAGQATGPLSPRPMPTPTRSPTAGPVVQAVQAPLPVLSPTQAAQLRTLLGADAMAQGLRYTPPDATTPTLDGEALVRAALDHARAVHAGRLDTADFDHNWGLRPIPCPALPTRYAVTGWRRGSPRCRRPMPVMMDW